MLEYEQGQTKQRDLVEPTNNPKSTEQQERTISIAQAYPSRSHGYGVTQAAYPFNNFIGKLIDNYSQPRGCMMKMEAKLLKTGMVEEFNWQFQDNVDRRVFKRLTAGEARA
jgi:hypothetical protein